MCGAPFVRTTRSLSSRLLPFISRSSRYVSSCLVHWVDMVVEKEDADVTFPPIRLLSLQSSISPHLRHLPLFIIPDSLNGRVYFIVEGLQCIWRGSADAERWSWRLIDREGSRDQSWDGRKRRETGYEYRWNHSWKRRLVFVYSFRGMWEGRGQSVRSIYSRGGPQASWLASLSGKRREHKAGARCIF